MMEFHAGRSVDDGKRPASLVRLEACDDPSRFILSVTDDLCVGPVERRFLFGGAGLGAALLAMERVTGRRSVCASAQFVSFARPGEQLSLQVRMPAAGRRISQATVTGSVGDRLVFSVAGSLGTGSENRTEQWSRLPDVSRPDDCPLVRHWRGDDGVHAGLDIRVAKGRYGLDRVGAAEPDGRLVLWVRPRRETAIDVAFLAILADLMPGGVGNAMGENVGGNSLDNVLRIGSLSSPPWIMVDIRLIAIGSGIAHGTVVLSTDEGSIMAHGSQSTIIR